MAATMTPLAFAKKYLELDVYVFPPEVSSGGPKAGYVPPTGWQRLKADNYRLGKSPWRDIFWSQDIQKQFVKPVTVCVKTISGSREEVVFRNGAQASYHFLAPFLGKGSPEQVQMAIQLVYRFRKVITPLEVFVDKDFIGLDCNGFVGNYYQKVVQGQHWQSAKWNTSPGPESLMEPLLKLGDEIKELTDLQVAGTYIFAWCDDRGNIMEPNGKGSYGHVMITEPNTLKGAPGAQTIQVVEATAAGKRKLRYLDYTLKSATKVVVKGQKVTVFKVQRGPGEKDMDVRISRLKV